MSEVLTTDRRCESVDMNHVIGLREDLDLASVPALTTQVREAVCAGQRQIVLDLFEVRFVDSTGLGCIAALTREAAARGATLTVANPSPMTERVLVLTGLHRSVSVNA